MSNSFFTITHQSKQSLMRTGIIHTTHGDIETPSFVPVATKASLKSLTSEEIIDTKSQLIFINTYHLFLRPGLEIIKKAKGVHSFMNYQGPLISDSGGFQVFSLGFGLVHGVGKIANIFPDEGERNINFERKTKSLVKIDDDGVSFQSHIDGTQHRLTPEKSMEIQGILGSDIALMFDECTSPLSSKSYVTKALHRTIEWAKRCCTVSRPIHQSIYSIIQGGHFSDLRRIACTEMQKIPSDGYAIGGDFGKSKAQMVKISGLVMQNLNSTKPRHVLGIGEIDDIFHIIENGADTFDCIMPTRMGRMGFILHTKPKSKLPGYTYDISKIKYAEDFSPLDSWCECCVCQKYTKAYIHHLFRTRELLGYHLATYHNVYMLNSLITEIRIAIKNNTFQKLQRRWLL